MEIQASSTTATVSLASIVRATNGQGKVSFPVNSQDLAYANFKNINIVPTGKNSGSYSVSRLRALDNLIEQLNRLKGQYKIEVPEADKMESEDLNSLISELSKKIHNKLNENIGYSNSLETRGLLFNFTV
jgi:hypothetical protein